MKKRIFISSVQREFAEERQRLKRYIEANPILRRFFEVFVFETDVPPTDMRTDEVYLAEVAKCDVYVALVGRDYGFEDAAGVSPTEREYDEATRLGKRRIVLVDQECDAERCEKEAAFLKKISAELTWHGYNNENELLNWLIAALDKVLSDEKVYRELPFEDLPCDHATLENIDDTKIRWFLKRARNKRNFKLEEETSVEETLDYLHLYDKSSGRPTNAAILLFAKEPQYYHISSEVKCVHWHGTEAHKPTLAYHNYRGNLFELVDQAVEFVLARIDLRVGTHDNGPTAERTYEIPESVIAEAIVNAIAHRNYFSTGSVQVELYADRLEVCNPGSINSALKKEDLFKRHRSYPNNPHIAEPLYLTKYIERLGSGFTDLINACREAGLPPPRIEDTGSECVLTIWRDNARGEVSGVVNGPVNGPVNGLVNQSRSLLNFIRKNPGLRKNQIACMTGMTERTVKRYIAECLNGSVEFRGAPKTGGYYVIEQSPKAE